MKKLLMLVFCMAFPTTVLAQNASWLEDTITFEWPTSRVDGTPLQPSELDRVEIEVRDGPAGSPIAFLSVPYPGTSIVNPRSAPYTGVLCYAATVFDIDGLQSDYSNEVCKTVNAKPNKPTIVEVK